MSYTNGRQRPRRLARSKSGGAPRLGPAAGAGATAPLGGAFVQVDSCPRTFFCVERNLHPSARYLHLRGHIVSSGRHLPSKARLTARTCTRMRARRSSSIGSRRRILPEQVSDASSGILEPEEPTVASTLLVAALAGRVPGMVHFGASRSAVRLRGGPPALVGRSQLAEGSGRIPKENSFFVVPGSDCVVLCAEMAWSC